MFKKINSSDSNDRIVEDKQIKEVELTEEQKRNMQKNIKESKELESEEITKKRKVERILNESFLGEYLAQESVTDISFNGSHLYIQDNIKGRYRVDSSKQVTEQQINNLAYQVAQVVGKNFTTTDAILDTELDFLRLNFVHKDVSPSGCTMSIRVSKPRLAISRIADVSDEDVERLIQLFMMADINLTISGKTGSGKSIANSEIVPTPEGDLLMGDIRVGDYVYDRYGKPTKVLGVYPQGKLDVYELELKDGRKVRCSKDHIWSVYTSVGNLTNKTVEEILDDGLNLPNRNEKCYKYYIPVNGVVEKSEKQFKVHPYVMGAFLGDGCLTKRALEISSEDDWIPNKIAGIIESQGTVKQKGNYSWVFKLPKNFDNVKNGINKLCTNFQTSQLFPEDMRKTCNFRYIPKEYFEGSVEQRYQLLQGLMDTDGSISKTDGKRYNVTFKTTSEQLAKDVKLLGHSLGYKMSLQVYKYIGSDGQYKNSYEVRFLIYNSEKTKIFSLPRKVEIAKICEGLNQRVRYDRVPIIKITKLDYQEEMTCIEVEHEEHLFLVKDYICTHNTELVRHVII